jgi:hypothetical protein
MVTFQISIISSTIPIRIYLFKLDFFEKLCPIVSDPAAERHLLPPYPYFRKPIGPCRLRQDAASKAVAAPMASASGVVKSAKYHCPVAVRQNAALGVPIGPMQAVEDAGGVWLTRDLPAVRGRSGASSAPILP